MVRFSEFLYLFALDEISLIITVLELIRIKVKNQILIVLTSISPTLRARCSKVVLTFAAAKPGHAGKNQTWRFYLFFYLFIFFDRKILPAEQIVVCRNKTESADIASPPQKRKEMMVTIVHRLYDRVQTTRSAPVCAVA